MAMAKTSRLLICGALFVLVQVAVLFVVIGSLSNSSSCPTNVHDLFHLRRSAATATATATKAKGTVHSLPQPHYHYDLVTLIHHNDMTTFMDYGLESWIEYFASSERSLVYAICTPQAHAIISDLRKAANKDEASQRAKSPVEQLLEERVILVHERHFPFALHEMTSQSRYADKPTWIFQQLLKLYAYQVLSDGAKVQPPLAAGALYLVVDSDTVAVRPMQFVTTTPTTNNNNNNGQGGQPIYNIAAEQSGAFPNDCDAANTDDGLFLELFPDGSLLSAFPPFNQRKFTSITHMMLFNGTIVNEFLRGVEDANNNKKKNQETSAPQHAWQIMQGVGNVLTEWGLYMAWIMKHHRDEIAIRQIPYVNWGNVNKPNLLWLKNERDVVYATKHDDWGPLNICCVNSPDWSRMNLSSVTAETSKNKHLACKCCPADNNCENVIITCEILGMKGCHQHQDGTIRFSPIL